MQINRFQSEQEWVEMFADNLRDAMRERGYNQEELSAYAGVPQSSINRYLKAKSMPSLHCLMMICVEIGLGVEEMGNFDKFVV